MRVGSRGASPRPASVVSGVGRALALLSLLPVGLLVTGRVEGRSADAAAPAGVPAASVPVAPAPAANPPAEKSDIPGVPGLPGAGIPGLPGAAPAEDKPVIKVGLLSDVAGIKPGTPFRLLVTFEVGPDGWHVYGRDPGEVGSPTTVKLAPVPGLTFGTPVYPTPKRVFDSDLVQHWMPAEFAIIVPVDVAADFAPAGGKVELTAVADWLACKSGGSCEPPSGLKERTATLTLPVVAADPTPAEDDVLSKFKAVIRTTGIDPARAQKGKASATLTGGTPAAGAETELTVRLVMDAGWHVFPNTAPKGYIPTELTLDLPAAVERDAVPVAGRTYRVSWPPPDAKHPLTVGGKKVESDFHEGTLELRTKLKIVDAERLAKLSGPQVVRAWLRYQTCDKSSCQPPQMLRFEVPLALAGVAADPAGTGPTAKADPKTDNGAAAKADAKTGTGPATGATAKGDKPGTGPVTTGATAGLEAAPQAAWPSVGDLLLQLGIGLLAGMALNFMPCVLPVLGLKIVSFVQQGKEAPGRVLRLGVSFSAGLILVFLVLGAVTAGARIGWGEQFGNPVFMLVVMGIITVFALSLMGVWTLHPPEFVNDLGAQTAQAEGYGGAFVKGMLTTLLATPCTGPGLGALMGWAATQTPVVIVAVFLAVGVGMALPYLVLSANPALLKKMPRPGPWMEKFERVMGFVLLGSVVWFLMGFAGIYGQMDRENLADRGLYTTHATGALLGAVGFLTFLSLGVWIIATMSDQNARVRRPVAGWVTGVGVSVIGFVLMFSLLSGTPKLALWGDPDAAGRKVVGRDDLLAYTAPESYLGVALHGEGSSAGGSGKAAGGGAAAEEPLGKRLAKAKSHRDRVKILAAAGYTVHVDFTADWCANCKVVEKAVLHTDATKKLFAELGVVSQIADWTDTGSETGEQIREWLAELKMSGIPVQAIYPAGKPDAPIVIGGVFTQGQFEEAVRKAGASTAKAPAGGAASDNGTDPAGKKGSEPPAKRDTGTPAKGAAIAPVMPDGAVGASGRLGADLGATRGARDRVRKLVEAGYSVHVCFTAVWCAPCQVLKSTVLAAKETHDTKAELGVLTHIADWSDTTGETGREVAAWIAQLKMSGVPLQAVYPAGRPDEPILLPSMFTQAEFTAALRKAGASTAKTPAGN